MKNDILIQEGDIIEDIIFIKNGVLSLEIIIDLKDPIKSIESHLESTGNDCFKYIPSHKFNTLINLSTLNNNNNIRTIPGKQVYNEKDNNKKAIRIIDLRKNEHFGDILMILNEKSPLTVKVKSQKAELFFLQKTEATEISNRYSNIWKRIVNRSLHNMKQIKNLIRKKILFFVENNNIQIDPELKKQYLIDEIKSLNIKNKNKSSKYIETILEEDENTIRNKNQSDISENDKSQKENKKKKKVCFEKKKSGKNEGILKDKSLISEKSQEGEKQPLKGSKKKSGFKNEEFNHKLKEENKHQKEIIISIMKK